MPEFLRSLAARAVVLAAFLSGPAIGAPGLVFAVNEGVSYRVPNEEIRGRYAAIAADLSKILKQPVTVEPVGDYNSLRKGLAGRSFDLAMVHPAHVSIQAMKQSGYRLVVITKGFQNYTAQFLARSDSPLAAPADLKGQTLGAPDEDSITAVMVRATLRDARVEIGSAPPLLRLSYTRYQDAVPFFVENKLTAAGATASNAIVKAWLAKGGKVIGKSRAVPIKHIIASPNMSDEQVASVREYLLSLDASDEGRKKLAPTKYAGFERYDQAALLALGTWLGL
jgi:phosphonate transport system substrate-binding protein